MKSKGKLKKFWGGREVGGTPYSPLRPNAIGQRSAHAQQLQANPVPGPC